MKPVEAYILRMALVNAGHIPVPCRDGKPVYIPPSMPSEPAVRSWATLHENAYETGILDLQTQSVTMVTEVPTGSLVTEMPTANQRRKEATALTGSDATDGVAQGPWCSALGRGRG